MESWTQVELISKDLLRYVDEHFHREEAILTAMKYPDLAAHVSQHVTMASKVRAFHDRLTTAAGDDEKRSCSHLLVKTLGEWLVNHILKEDMKYRNFIPRKVARRPV